MSIKREDFLRLLESAQAGLSPNRINEQDDCFVALGGFIYTFNEEIACRVPSPLGKATKGAIPADKLLDLLRKLKEDDLQISNGQGELLIKGKGRKAGIRMDPEVSLGVDAVEIPKAWNKLHPDFGDAVATVGQCAAEKEADTRLTCVHVHPKWLQACSRFQLCRWPLKTGIGGDSGTLIRRDSIKHVSSLGMAEWAETESWLHFRNASGLVLSCRRYMEKYPPLSKHLEVEGEKCILPKGLAEAAEKAAIFSTENAGDKLVRIDLSPGKLVLRGQGISGWYRETKKVKYEGRNLCFLIPPEILIDVVNKHSEVVVNESKLMAKTLQFTFVSCLDQPRTEDDAEGEGVEQ